jgi:hypothetical protein
VVRYILHSPGLAPCRWRSLSSNVRPRRTRPSHARSTENHISAPTIARPRPARHRSSCWHGRGSRPHVCRGCSTSELGRSLGCLPGKLCTAHRKNGLNGAGRNGCSGQASAKEMRVHVRPVQQSQAATVLYSAPPAPERSTQATDPPGKELPTVLASSVVTGRSVAAASSGQAIRIPPARPNPSLKRSANGRPPGPGRWYAVHFHRPGPGVLPSSPA